MSSTGCPSVPFLDLAADHRPLSAAFLRDISEIIDSSAFINGVAVREFEAEFAAWCGADHCVGLASGLDAIRLGLAAVGVGRGDEVIVPAMTFVATWEAVSQVGATPIPAEILSGDYCIDPAAVEAAISPRTKAIVPVHLYGQSADLATLRRIAAAAGLAVVEDAAQAHGAHRSGERIGAVGFATAYSFYPGKNLGALGDAGALTTNDPEVADRVRALREHGQRQKYHHDLIGWTARLDTIQAAALRTKLPHLQGWNERRRAAAASYSALLDGVGDLVLPPVAVGSSPVWHLYVIRTSDPDGLAAHLGSQGISSGRHYPVPPHLTAAYADLGHGPGSFPVSEEVARECLSLPIFPSITEEQIGRVSEAVRAWFDGG
ncbi:MAG: DegT/DnrJ/EryC1/StrS family aminotransferase [Gaiella sp.]